MADKDQLKVPTDFADPKEWRAYIRQTVPPEEVEYTLAFGRTTLFIRFYETRGQMLPEEFSSELNRIQGLSDPERTALLVALNGRIFAAMTQLFLASAGGTNPATGAGFASNCSRDDLDNLLDYLAKKNPNFAIWCHYTKQVQQEPDAPSWEEFVAEEFCGEAEDEIEFTLLMGQLGKLVVLFRDRNLVLPPFISERIWFLHHLRGAERNLQTRAVVQGLVEEVQSCASA